MIGVEGAASGSTMKRTTTVGLPLGNPDIALVKANTDFLPSVTARIGFAFDNVLLYARGGAALAGDKFDVTGSFAGAPFAFDGLDNRFGWTVGGGVDWAFTRHWSLNVEYDYYQFGHGAVMMADPINGFAGVVDVRQRRSGRQGRVELSYLGTRLVMFIRSQIAADVADERLLAVLTFPQASRAQDARRVGEAEAGSRPSWNIARPATVCRARAIWAIFRCRAWPDSSRNTSRPSCGPSSNAGGPTRSCSTSRMCSARRC